MPDALLTLGMALACVVAVLVGMVALADRARRRIEAGDAVRFLRESRPATGAEQLGVTRG